MVQVKQLSDQFTGINYDDNSNWVIKTKFDSII